MSAAKKISYCLLQGLQVSKISCCRQCRSPKTYLPTVGCRLAPGGAIATGLSFNLTYFMPHSSVCLTLGLLLGHFDPKEII